MKLKLKVKVKVPREGEAEGEAEVLLRRNLPCQDQSRNFFGSRAEVRALKQKAVHASADWLWGRDRQDDMVAGPGVARPWSRWFFMCVCCVCV
jgi:hypothetical protein